MGCEASSGTKPSGSLGKTKVAEPPFVPRRKEDRTRGWTSASLLLYCFIILKTRSCQSQSHKQAQGQPPSSHTGREGVWRTAWLFAAPLPRAWRGEPGSWREKSICNYTLGKLSSRKQRAHIILHRTNRRATEIHTSNCSRSIRELSKELNCVPNELGGSSLYYLHQHSPDVCFCTCR